MGESTDGIVLKQIQTLYGAGAIGGLSDGQLWDRALARRDDAAEAAFTILVERHGPMVFRICRQMLGDRHEAEDAFQATFLVLASKAQSIRNRDSVASWLHGVARRVALRSRADAARRRIHERRGAIPAEAPSPEDDGSGPGESWPELHEEIARLPERYREPIVLCYLEGLTTEAAAHRLGCPQGTILSRLSRARDRLRKRLTRRGLTVSAGLLAAALVPDTAMALPAALLGTTVRASLSFTARQTAGATVASASAIGLARGVIYAMTLSQWKTFGAATLACILATGGLRAFAQFGGIGAADEPAAVKPATDDRQAALTRSVAKIQDELDEANRRNAELQKQLQTIRAELKTLRAGPLTAEDTKPDERPTTDLTVPAAEHSSQNSPLKYTTIGGPGGSALLLEGPKITRIAASSGNGRWVAQALREPVNGVATPSISLGCVTYSLGRYVYAFSPKREAWGVLELPKGTKGIEPDRTGGAPTLLVDGHMYTFDVSTANWEDVDFRAILDSPGAEPAERMSKPLLLHSMGQAPSPATSRLGPARP